MAAAAPLDFNGFLGNIAALGTVNTDGPGFVAAMAYALTEAGRLKSWSNPATAVQLGMLTSRIRAAQIDWSQFDTTNIWHDQPIGWWSVVGTDMITHLAARMPTAGGPRDTAKQFSESEQDGSALSTAETTAALENARWPQLVAAIESSDYDTILAIIDTSTPWGKLIWRAKTFWSATGNLSTKDPEKIRLCERMQELHKLHGAAVNRKHNDDLFADQENRHPVATSFLKTLSALPTVANRGASAITAMLCQAMADILGIKLIELRAKHTTALRKSLSAMLTLLDLSWGPMIGTGTAGRAAAIFDNWAAVDPQFIQYSRLHGGAPENGAFKYISEVILPRISRWIMEYWAHVWQAEPYPGTLWAYLAPAAVSFSAK